MPFDSIHIPNIYSHTCLYLCENLNLPLEEKNGYYCRFSLPKSELFPEGKENTIVMVVIVTIYMAASVPLAVFNTILPDDPTEDQVQMAEILTLCGS